MLTNRLVLLLSVLILLTFQATAQSGDLGAQIAAEDAALGASPGQIHVVASGTISEGKVSLSAGHDLVCANNVVISLQPGSYIYQSSHTRIRNCTISATSTPIQGEIQSINTEHVALDKVSFQGGGNLLYWSGVTNFAIRNTDVISITGYDPANNWVQLGLYLIHCTHGTVDHLTSQGFVFPSGADIPAVLGIFLSDDVTITNTAVSHVDASYDVGGSVIQVGGSSHITVTGGEITHNPNMDGVTTEDFGATPSSYITITGLDASYNGEVGQNTAAPLGLGDGIDIINSSNVLISNCTLNRSGYLANQQPAIWLFLDDGVIVENTDMSDGSMGGIDIAGSPNVQLINNTIDRNQAAGVLGEWQGGTATNVGAKVTFVAGVSGSFGVAWKPGTQFLYDGVPYQIASIQDSSHLTLTTAPPDHSSPANWGVDSTNQQIWGGEINDNGQGKFGGQLQVGISWADSTSGIIAGVTATDTGAGTQLYALDLANTASATLYGDNFGGNVLGGNGINGPEQAISPSSLSFPGQGLSTTSSPQTVTLTVGAVAIQNLLIEPSGDFAEKDNCTSPLAGFATCQIQVTFTPTATGARSGSLTISDNAPNSPQTVLLTGAGVSQGLGLSIVGGGTALESVAKGATATYSLSIGGAGIGGLASLTCAGAPSGASCISPSSVAFSGSQATTFTVSVKTQSPIASSLEGQHGFWLWGVAIFGLCLLPTRTNAKQSVRRLVGVLTVAMLLTLCSCGQDKKASGSTGTPAGTYTLTVTARVGGTSEQIPLMLTVE